MTHTGGITLHTPGRTSQTAAAGFLSAGEKPSLFFGCSVTFPFTVLTGHYINIPAEMCQEGATGAKKERVAERTTTRSLRYANY